MLPVLHAVRDEVAGQVLQQPGREAFLVLGQAGAEEFGLPATQFYCSRGLLHKVRSALQACGTLSGVAWRGVAWCGVISGSCASMLDVVLHHCSCAPRVCRGLSMRCCCAVQCCKHCLAGMAVRGSRPGQCGVHIRCMPQYHRLQ